MDLAREHTIRESSHRLLNPLTPAKLATLGEALQLTAGMTILDLACGKGELLCTWARDHGTAGTGVDISTVFTRAARARADELAVAGQVSFVHDNATGYVADQPVDVAACIGASWVGGGTVGTVELLERSLRPGGLMLLGEVFWRREPPDEETARQCHVSKKSDVHALPELIEVFHDLGWDLVEMVLADEDSWDRYCAAHWFNVRAFLDANPDDELAGKMRDELSVDPVRYVRYQRQFLGWGVFALKKR